MPRPYALRSAAAALVFLCACGAAPQKPPNVLFIAVDDLRPQTGAYGESGMVTPNFDRFAAQARLFERHYVQVPTCGASRYALLTGNRPASAAHTRNDAIRDLLPKTEQETPESFAHLFRRAGYRTVSIGKISHYVDGRIYSYEGEGEGEFEMPFSWDRRIMPYEKWGTAWNAFFRLRGRLQPQHGARRLPAVRECRCPRHRLPRRVDRGGGGCATPRVAG